MLALMGLGILVWLGLGGLAAPRLAGLKATDGMIWVATLARIVVAALIGVIIPPHGLGFLDPNLPEKSRPLVPERDSMPVSGSMELNQ